MADNKKATNLPSMLLTAATLAKYRAQEVILTRFAETLEQDSEEQVFVQSILPGIQRVIVISTESLDKRILAATSDGSMLTITSQFQRETIFMYLLVAGHDPIALHKTIECRLQSQIGTLQRIGEEIVGAAVGEIDPDTLKLLVQELI